MKVVTTDEVRRIEKAADAGGLFFATMIGVLVGIPIGLETNRL